MGNDNLRSLQLIYDWKSANCSSSVQLSRVAPTLNVDQAPIFLFIWLTCTNSGVTGILSQEWHDVHVHEIRKKNWKTENCQLVYTIRRL